MSSTLTSLRGALLLAAIAVASAACGSQDDSAVAARATRALESVETPFSMVYDESLGAAGEVRWAVTMHSADRWEAEIVSSDDLSVPEHLRIVREGDKVTTIEPNVLDLSAVFTDEEIRAFTEKLGADAPYVVQELIDEGVLVPGDQERVEQLGPEDADRVPTPIIGVVLHHRDLSGVRELERGGARIFSLPFGEDTRMIFDGDGTPVGIEDHIDGNWISVVEVIEFTRGP